MPANSVWRARQVVTRAAGVVSGQTYYDKVVGVRGTPRSSIRRGQAPPRGGYMQPAAREAETQATGNLARVALDR